MTSWHSSTPAWYTETATRVCTPKQLEVLQHLSHNHSDRNIARKLQVTRETIRDHRRVAHDRITRELDNSREGAA